MPISHAVILAIYEAEIRRIEFETNPRQKVYKTPSQPIAVFSGMPVIPSCIGG
jgi:hypothetical protein